MRTLLSQFCEEFEGAVRPLLEPLRDATDSLDGAPPELPVRDILPGIRDVRHQLEALADKVAGQQAYVLIFGPLKSGKSTLMNAMAASYVSEVTSLPAYPCMVYVQDSEERELKVTRYSGETETFTDPAAMRLLLVRAHTELAEQIRAVEARGEDFDPGVHFPEAIRRVDVKLPAGHLARSGAVLVDTPGLYTRMKFGYDRMTRDFRDAAACAIFVVKTDNLFLEQVFAEFSQLLDLFSRIFLVVNLDTTKKDLRPDGSLVPSLEHDDPLRIIEAFENLAMGAALKGAVEEGRLRIYPVDLLQAAARRIRGEDLHTTPEPGDVSGHDTPPEKQADFEAFLGDLTRYLDSNEYLVAFLGDSLRHARRQLEELGELCARDSVRELAHKVETLEQDRERTEFQARRLERLRGFAWEEAFGELRERLQGVVRNRAAEIHERTRHALVGALDEWFRNDASLRTLLEDEVAPLLVSSQNEVAALALGALKEAASADTAGANLPVEVRAALGSTRVRLEAVGREALESLDPTAGVVGEAPALAIEDIPVRKSFWDWLFFRSRTKVRRRLFGAGERPANRILRAVKQKRLGQPAREAMRRALEAQLDGFLPAALRRLVERIHTDFTTATVAGVRAEIQARSTETAGHLAEVRRSLAELTRVREHLAALAEAAGATRNAVEELTHRYGSTEPERLREPVAAPDDDEVVVRKA